MQYDEIVRSLPLLDDAQLRALNTAVVQQIKAGRRVSQAVAAVTIVVGNEYITTGLRSKDNGLRVRVLEKKQTKALVDWAGRRVLVPMNCLSPI